MESTRVAMVEDDEVLRESLSDSVQQLAGVTLVGAAATLTEARELLSQNPDLFLVDLSLPDGSGLDLIRASRARSKACKTIVLSVFGDSEHVLNAIESGADGYLLKGVGLDQLADAIRTVMAGGAPLSPAVASHLLRRLRAGAPRAPSLPVLTQREFEVLEGLSKGLTLKEVADLHRISVFTVGDHVKAIYRKLQVNSRAEAIFEAVRSGLLCIET